MPEQSKVPMPTLERLATYHAILKDLKNRSVDTISSTDVEEKTGINAAQFRKDLSYFGEFGRPGIGYNVDELYCKINEILKLHNTQPVLLVGAGNLGSALAGYPALKSEGFRIVAVFDSSANKIGQTLWDLTVKNIDSLIDENKKLQARIGIICVPANSAQKVAETLVKAGVSTILNFAPIALKLPDEIKVRNVDFVKELAVLSYHIPD
ncbi:MAG: redox-sensing transcriptional repressor Rex [Armatimonadota bacterium]